MRTSIHILFFSFDQWSLFFFFFYIKWKRTLKHKHYKNINDHRKSKIYFHCGPWSKKFLRVLEPPKLLELPFANICSSVWKAKSKLTLAFVAVLVPMALLSLTQGSSQLKVSLHLLSWESNPGSLTSGDQMCKNKNPHQMIRWGGSTSAQV